MSHIVDYMIWSIFMIIYTNFTIFIYQWFLLSLITVANFEILLLILFVITGLITLIVLLKNFII